MNSIKKGFICSIFIILALVFTSCTTKNIKTEPEKPQPTASPTVQAQKPEEKPAEPAEPIGQNKINVNENGKIMILMYHGIGDKEAEWVRQIENFKKDLQVLYDKGYRLISLKDYLDNNINVAAGFTPFVLTFDDSVLNQFNYIQTNGTNQIDPNCAVGILETFFKSHPDFGRGGSFYIYYPIPFRQKDLIGEKLLFLVNNGYEIGNHSYNHDNLSELTPEAIQKTLALNVAATQKYLPGYNVFSLALPNGGAPRKEDYQYAISGTFQGTAYKNRAILRVGSTPAYPPNHIKFDPVRLPRVRGSEMKTEGTGLYDWLKYYDKHPENKYISDGKPDTITIPTAQEGSLNKESISGKKLIVQ